MNYIDLLNHFWRVNKTFSFTPNEKTVYFTLLYKWNDLHRKNPFNFSNQHLTDDAGMSVNAMKKAREMLKLHGLIDFNSGDGRKINTNYVINDSIKGVTYGYLLMKKVSSDDSSISKKVSEKMSPDDPLIQEKVSLDDDYISKLIEESAANVKTEKTEGFSEAEIAVLPGIFPVYSSMDDVEFICLNQSTVWLEHITRKLSLKNAEETKKWVIEFFDTQRASGQDKKDLNDARSHCYNWINLQVKKEKSSAKKEDAEPLKGFEAAMEWGKVERRIKV